MKLNIEFCDGRYNGRTLRASTTADESNLAVLLFRLSDYGTIGKQFCFIPPESLETIDVLGFDSAVAAGHLCPVNYQVTSCVRKDESITVRAQHVSASSTSLKGQRRLETQSAS